MNGDDCKAPSLQCVYSRPSETISINQLTCLQVLLEATNALLLQLYIFWVFTLETTYVESVCVLYKFIYCKIFIDNYSLGNRSDFSKDFYTYIMEEHLFTRLSRMKKKLSKLSLVV